MPNLPVHEAAQRPIQTTVSNQPAVIQQQGAEKAYEGTGAIIKAAQDAAALWQTAQDTMDYTKHSAEKSSFLSQQEILAANDPDPDNIKTYQAALNDYKKTALSGFHNKELAARVSFELEKDINITTLKIGGIFRGKQLYQNKIDLGTAIESLSNIKRTELNPLLKQEAQDKIDTLLIANLANGTITQAEARNLKNLQVKSDILSDNSVRETDSPVLKDLRAGEKGPYNYLSQDERLDAIKDMQSRIFQNNQTYKRDVEYLQTDTAIATAKNLVDKKLTYLDIEAGIKSGTLDAKTAKVFTSALEGKRVETEKEPILVEAYLRLFDKNLEKDVLAKQIIVNATKEWQNGNIEDDEYALFIQQAQKKLERERGNLTGWDKVTEAFKNGISILKSFGTGDMVNMYKQFMDRSKEGKPEEAAAEIVQQERLNKYPWMSSISEKGEIRLFPDGVKRRVYPNGKIEDLK